MSHHSILCNTSLGFLRPIVPISLHRRVFENLHSLAHPGTRPTKRLIAAQYVCPGHKKDVTSWARSCLSCQQSKISCHVVSPLQNFPVQNSRFKPFHVNIVGPLPPQEVTHISSMLLTSLLIGQKQFQWLTPPLKLVPRLSFQGGLFALVCQIPSPLTTDAISCHTIHKPMVWLRECIGKSKLASKQGSPRHPGVLNFSSSSWA